MYCIIVMIGSIKQRMMMKINIAGCLVGLGLLAGCDHKIAAEVPVEGLKSQPEFVEKTVIGFTGTKNHKFLNNYQVYSEGWDTLAQARFWQDVIALSHDSMIINVACVRQPLYKVSTTEWHCQTELEKDLYKQNLVIDNRLEQNTNIFVTSGKKFFFEYKKVLPMISQALPVFEKYDTDPWYAQTILLIESPGKTEARSYVGARGPFQLMPYVAKKYGLVVTKYRDDRTDLTKSAMAAAKLISNICIPYAKKILDERSISYNEKDLWFRLFVMHIYHAGAGNVSAVVEKIAPTEGGMTLIRQMWQNEARGFKNESQNYSQIALASIINFDRLISQDNDTVYLVEGDKNMKFFHEKTKICVDTLAFFKDCLAAYESDLVEGTIPFDYFASRVLKVRTEMSKYTLEHGESHYLSNILESERMYKLGNELMYKRKFNEAIMVFQLGLEKNPISPATYESLVKAYRSIGNNELALKYSKKSKELSENPDTFVR